MKITRENLKNIVRESMIEENEYQEFFKKALEKTGKSIPQMSDEEKKAFFNKIDASWKGKGEKKESVDMDIDEEAVVVSKRTPEGNIVSKLKEELTDAQKKLPPALQKAIAKKKDKKEESVNEGNNPKFKVGDMVKYKGAKVSAKVLKVMPTNWENGYLIQFQDNKKKEEAGESSLVKESVNEVDTKKANLLRKNMPGYVGPKFAKKASDEDLLAMADLKDEKAQLYNRYLKDVMSKISNLQKKYNIKESVNESQVVNKKTGKDITRHVLDLLSGKIDKKQFEKLTGLKKESTNERLGSDKVEVGNANFNNHLKEIGDDKNSFVAFIDTNKGKKLLKVFKTQQTAKRFVNKNMDKMLDTKGVESIGTMSKKEWDTKEAKYAIK